MNQLSEKELHLHVSIVGWLTIVANGIFLLVGVCGFALLSAIGVFAAADSGDPVALGVLGIIGAVSLLFFAALSLPGMLAGVGLLRRKKWGQILGILVAVLGLLNFPVGTALGAYTLFVLFQSSATAYFDWHQAEPAKDVEATAVA